MSHIISVNFMGSEYTFWNIAVNYINESVALLHQNIQSEYIIYNGVNFHSVITSL